MIGRSENHSEQRKILFGESKRPTRPYLTVVIPKRHVPHEDEEDHRRNDEDKARKEKTMTFLVITFFAHFKAFPAARQGPIGRLSRGKEN